MDYQGDMDKLLTRRYERTGRAEHLDEVVTERAARLQMPPTRHAVTGEWARSVACGSP